MRAAAGFLGLLITLFTGAAYSFSFNWGNVAAGSTNQALERQQQQQNEQIIQNGIMDDYRQCLQSHTATQTYHPDTKIYDTFDAEKRKAIRCSADAAVTFKREHPDSLAMWYITRQLNDAHSILDKADLITLTGKQEECWQPIINYSGKKDIYLDRAVHASLQMYSAESMLLSDYIEDKVTRADVLKKEPVITRTYDREMAKIGGQLHNHIKEATVNTTRGPSPEQQNICEMQLSLEQDRIKQQQEIQKLKQERLMWQEMCCYGEPQPQNK